MDYCDTLILEYNDMNIVTEWLPTKRW